MDLVSDGGLASACNQAVAARQSDPGYATWTARLTEFIGSVGQATEATFRSQEFQRKLWESDVISATGLGFVPTQELWGDSLLLDILWRVRNLDPMLPEQTRTDVLAAAWDAAIGRIKQIAPRVPRLKLARVFAALQPANFTTLANGEALIQLARELGVGKASDHKVILHQRILDRLDQVLPNVDGPPEEDRKLLRLKLPWLLYERLAVAPVAGVTVAPGDKPGEVQLQPLPANRRRRGMLAIAGLVPSVLAMIQFVKDGCSREDLREHVRSINPNLAPGSVNTNINALIAEWGVLAAEGDHMTLTARGAAFLESEDPDDVSDWLLTQILGFDNALYVLRDQPREQKTLISDLQRVNPGWTSNFAPTAMINWLRGLGLAEYAGGRTLKLTPRGEDWASRIHWVPGVLEPTATPSAATSVAVAVPELSLNRPNVDQLMATFPPDMVFPRQIVAQLDAALWSHQRRHFVVLTGLSGAGKTQLALNYAQALWGQEKQGAKAGTHVLPVQPGWHDPTAVLGYVNPLNTERYIRTDFLNFLLNAVRDPERPYTVILDEMNLSHPEQYLSPLLSAMETGLQIELHSQDEDIEEIPPSVPYPSNLLIIGTVNMDETTHGLSDKVLDRASVIEFWDIDTDQYPGWKNSGLDAAQVNQLRDLLKTLGAALAPARLHFGWRTVGDVLGYVRAALAGGAIPFNTAVDQAVYAKVLPKLRGEDSPRLRTAFRELTAALQHHDLPVSAAKVSQLDDDLAHLGSARFWR